MRSIELDQLIQAFIRKDLNLSPDHTALGHNATGDSVLNYAHFAGDVRVDNAVVHVAAGTVALTNNATNYVEVNSAGVVSANVVGFTSGRIPLATVLTASGAISTVTDKRVWLTVSTDPGAAGDMIGPASSTAHHLAGFSGADGKHAEFAGIFNDFYAVEKGMAENGVRKSYSPYTR